MIRNLSHAGHCYGCHNADFFHADRKTSAQHCVFLRVQYHLFYALRRIRRCHVELQRTPLRQKHRIALPSHQLHIVRRNAVITILEYNFPVASADHDANLCSAPSCLHQDHRSQFPCVCICKMRKLQNILLHIEYFHQFIHCHCHTFAPSFLPFYIFLAFRPSFSVFQFIIFTNSSQASQPRQWLTRYHRKVKIPRRRSSLPQHGISHFYFSTIIHFRGQFSAQRPQPVHFAGSISARWSTT